MIMLRRTFLTVINATCYILQLNIFPLKGQVRFQLAMLEVEVDTLSKLLVAANNKMLTQVYL